MFYLLSVAGIPYVAGRRRSVATPECESPSSGQDLPVNPPSLLFISHPHLKTFSSLFFSRYSVLVYYLDYHVVFTSPPYY